LGAGCREPLRGRLSQRDEGMRHVLARSPSLLVHCPTPMPMDLGARPEVMTDQMFFESAPEFREWLQSNAETASAILAIYQKVGTGRASMSYSESVDEALCFGWIDGVRKRVDDDTYSIRFTLRRPSSIWSAVNIAKVERLRAEGRMTPSGEEAFALRSEVKTGVYAHEQAVAAELSPAELRLFKRSRHAWKFFESTPPGYQRFVLHWVTSAKKEETRASRLCKLVEACAVSVRVVY
jgi:uncharacterized protein YdeI (YjbR/CyaY-like superfamily)